MEMVMPYIRKENREPFLDSVNQLSDSVSQSPKNEIPGNLNFILTKLIKDTYRKATGNNLRYEDYNAIIGMLECCKQEFYRTAITPYEVIKSIENGDV
jgi:hypothetical protein